MVHFVLTLSSSWCASNVIGRHAVALGSTAPPCNNAEFEAVSPWEKNATEERGTMMTTIGPHTRFLAPSSMQPRVAAATSANTFRLAGAMLSRTARNWSHASTGVHQRVDIHCNGQDIIQYHVCLHNAFPVCQHITLQQKEEHGNNSGRTRHSGVGLNCGHASSNVTKANKHQSDFHVHTNAAPCFS